MALPLVAIPAAVGLPIDWTASLRSIERKRRVYFRADPPRRRSLPPETYAELTAVSFALDGIDLRPGDVERSLSAGHAQRFCRSRLAQRLRNHVALLHHAQEDLRLGEPLKAATVVRWYASISCGLCTAALQPSHTDRIDAAVRRINFPQLLLRPMIEEIAELYAESMQNPLVPAFNGILSRLLLHYHLGRCGLPCVKFDPTRDRSLHRDRAELLARLLVLIDTSYDGLLKQ